MDGREISQGERHGEGGGGAKTMVGQNKVNIEIQSERKGLGRKQGRESEWDVL